MATTKKTTQKKSTPAKKKTSSKKVSLSPNSVVSRNRKTNSRDIYEGVFKTTNSKGKYDYIEGKRDTFNKPGSNLNTNTKLYTAYDNDKPRYEVSSRNYDTKTKKFGPETKHFEKSVDTTGYAAGKKSFTVVSKKKLPNGNMYKITKTKTGRKGAIDTINRMKKRASKPFTSSKATSSKQLTTKKK
jgi:hypothetical protein